MIVLLSLQRLQIWLEKIDATIKIGNYAFWPFCYKQDTYQFDADALFLY